MERRERLRRYEALLRTGPVTHLVTDPTGRIRALNEAAVELLGLSRTDAGDRSLNSLIEDTAALEARLEALRRDEPVTDWTTEVMDAAGVRVPVRVTAMPVAGPEGEGLELHWLMAESSADPALARERAARVALERVANRAAFVSEASRRLMGVLDPDAVWRTAAETVAEYSPGVVLLELVDGDRLEVRAVAGAPAPDPGREPLRGRVMSLRSDDESILGVASSLIVATLREAEPVTVDGPDGTALLVVPLRAHVSARGVMLVRTAAGTNVREEMLVSLHLAERIALALETAVLFQEVARARGEAEAAGATEADFLAVISHELRTPLTAIVSYAELLEQRAPELPEKVGRYAQQIAAAAAHHRQLVEQILSYRRLQQGDAEMEPEALDFRQAAKFAVSMSRPYVRDKPVELRLELPEEPVRGTADVAKLRQVLTNLLTNAIRHTPRGHVLLGLEPQAQWVVFRVEDTGTGIPADALPRIFDRFWRGPAPEGEPRGSGLGLTITRELVSRMGGKISVESEIGTGTRFTVRLPREA